MKHKDMECCEHEKGHHEMKKHDHHDHHVHMVEDFKKRFFISLILTIPVLALSPLIQTFFGFELVFAGSAYVLLVLSVAIYFYGGYPFLKGMFEELGKRNPGMMTLIGIATTVSFFYSAAVVFGIPGKFFFWELATLIVVMLFGHWMEMRSVLGASRSVEKLAELLPSVAHVLRGDAIVDISLSELKKGDKAIVKPGEKIPSDAIVVEGKAWVNESMLTGESKPVSKKDGDNVIGGSINGESSITVEIEKTGEETYLSQIIELVRKTQASKSRMQGLADRAAFWLTLIGITAGAITFGFWISTQEVVFALERAVTVLVITCPHALGLAIPLVIAVSTSIAAAHGFLIRNRTQFEDARDVDAVVFDKTGTLTEGKFEVSEIVSFSKTFKEKDLLRFAASLESLSEHSIGASIVKRAKEKKLKLAKVKSPKAIPGKGMKGIIGKDRITIASAAYAKELGLEAKAAGKGKTTVYLIVNKKLVGSISLEDRMRGESYEAVKKLRSMGIKCMMLTGDNKEVAKAVAEKLKLEGHFAEVLPEQKVGVIKELQDKGLRVAMVGDGINDAPALVQSDLGIAIGAGTDVAVESADIVLARNDPRDIPAILGLSKATYGKMLQNLGWATGYNLIAIPLAAGVLYSQGILLSPAIGALLMSASTVIVAINARMLKF
jgi:Cu2+-exporting ATPase